MNPDLERLQSYPFEKLAHLKAGCKPPAHLAHIALSIGEPQHPTPSFVSEELMTHMHTLSNYPTTRGIVPLRNAIADWLSQRFNLPRSEIDHERQILPVNGTREALFSFGQAVTDRTMKPIVMMPNPFYQIYEGAALLAGAEPYFLNTTANNNFIPELDAVPANIWQRCQLLYLCSPGNPTGKILPRAFLERVIALADEYDFVIAADECYSEIYPDEKQPPLGMLQLAWEMGRRDFKRIVVFHSLSKRSNVPGLRSGFVAGDKHVMDKFFLYRTYHGCAMPGPTQCASVKAWQDERHVLENRSLYRQKFQATLKILSPVLDVKAPDAAFYLWPRTPVTDTQFARELFQAKNVTVLPGTFLSRSAHGVDPGHHHVRMALVAPVSECIEAAERIRDFIRTG